MYVLKTFVHLSFNSKVTGKVLTGKYFKLFFGKGKVSVPGHL